MKTKQTEITPKASIEQISGYRGTLLFDLLPPGYGHTIGNSLRRVLLSSIEGYAITMIKLPEGILHEFDTIPGVIEDVSEIILNLKQIRFKKTGSEYQEKLSISFKNKTSFKAGALSGISNNFEVLNPDLVICSMDETADFQFEFKIEQGHGYVPAKDHEHDLSTMGVIPIDAVFTPVKNVNYKVENTLVGQRIDYEKIIVQIETDGSIEPKKALQKAAQKLVSFFSIFIEKDALSEEKEKPEETVLDKKTILIRKKLQKTLTDLGFSVRTSNALRAAKIETLGDIVQKSQAGMVKIRNLGKKSIGEVEAAVKKEGLTLGMDTTPYYIEKEEVF
ncbi:MAG: DNA-directed RNA polymerase subunit alpha [Bacteroidota bacterium]